MMDFITFFTYPRDSTKKLVRVVEYTYCLGIMSHHIPSNIYHRTKKALKEALNRNYHNDDEGNGFEMINYSFCQDGKCCVLYFIENLG